MNAIERRLEALESRAGTGLPVRLVVAAGPDAVDAAVAADEAEHGPMDGGGLRIIIVGIRPADTAPADQNLPITRRSIAD